MYIIHMLRITLFLITRNVSPRYTFIFLYMYSLFFCSCIYFYIYIYLFFSFSFHIEGYTSISVREPLANIIAQTKTICRQSQSIRPLTDPHYATVSDDSGIYVFEQCTQHVFFAYFFLPFFIIDKRYCFT